MGREIRRVPIDFDWPINEVWKGFVNPYYKPCDACKQGQTWAGWWLQKVCYLLHMMGEASLSDKPLHPWLQEFPMAPYELKTELKEIYPRGVMPPRDAYELKRPTTDMADLIEGLTGERPDPQAFGSLSKYRLYEKIVEVSGVEGFGYCKVCDGVGVKPEYRERYEAWEHYDPPTGEGWQLWETVSEGSPISPVFATGEELVDFLSTEGDAWKTVWRRSAAEQFVLRDSWAPSGVVVGGTFYKGAEDADRIAETRK